MWFLNVFLNLVTFIRLIFMADRHFRDERPDAVVLVDYPGLALVDRRPRQGAGIPVFYFVPPQIWAWAGWRVNKVRKYVDQVLCSLPFEPAWYHARGVTDAVYVGHPYFDELADRPLDEDFLAEQSRHARVDGGDPSRLADPGGYAQPARHGPGRREAGSRASRRSLRGGLPARAPQDAGGGNHRADAGN